jgi:hypothetical protein
MGQVGGGRHSLAFDLMATVSLCWFLNTDTVKFSSVFGYLVNK